jgi:hypothetical protein
MLSDFSLVKLFERAEPSAGTVEENGARLARGDETDCRHASVCGGRSSRRDDDCRPHGHHRDSPDEELEQGCAVGWILDAIASRGTGFASKRIARWILAWRGSGGGSFARAGEAPSTPQRRP